MFASAVFCALTSLAVAADDTNPVLRAAIAASTDVVVVEVLETKPRRAIEGARDTVKLKVVRSIRGAMPAGTRLGVYYHLLWVDAKRMVLEKPKFEQGQEYIVFLKASVEDRGEGRMVVYSLVDQWFAVYPRNEALEKELGRLIPKAEMSPGP